MEQAHRRGIARGLGVGGPVGVVAARPQERWNVGTLERWNVEGVGAGGRGGCCGALAPGYTKSAGLRRALLLDRELRRLDTALLASAQLGGHLQGLHRQRTPSPALGGGRQIRLSEPRRRGAGRLQELLAKGSIGQSDASRLLNGP